MLNLDDGWRVRCRLVFIGESTNHHQQLSTPTRLHTQTQQLLKQSFRTTIQQQQQQFTNGGEENILKQTNNQTENKHPDTHSITEKKERYGQQTKNTTKETNKYQSSLGSFLTTTTRNRSHTKEQPIISQHDRRMRMCSLETHQRFTSAHI